MNAVSFRSILNSLSQSDDPDELIKKVLGNVKGEFKQVLETDKNPIGNSRITEAVSNKIIALLSKHSGLLASVDIPDLENLQALVHMFTVWSANGQTQQQPTALENAVKGAIQSAKNKPFPCADDEEEMKEIIADGDSPCLAFLIKCRREAIGFNPTTNMATAHKVEVNPSFQNVKEADKPVEGAQKIFTPQLNEQFPKMLVGR